MKDRIPTHPGRVLIQPENGTPEYYATLLMADDPAQLGTDLNKLNLLSDATTALLRMPESPEPTVDLALKKLTEKIDAVFGSYNGSGSSRQIYLGFVPSAVLVMDCHGGTRYLFTSTSDRYYSGGLIVGKGKLITPQESLPIMEISDYKGFTVYSESKVVSTLYAEHSVANTGLHYYIAFR